MSEDNQVDAQTVENLNVVEQAYVPQIQVEVVYGLPNRQKLLTVMVDEGSTVEQAIDVSGIKTLFEEIDLTTNKVGIWNRAVKSTEVLSDLDRIEIYRPLIADPKEVRKRRAAQAIEEGRANKITGGRPKPI